MSDFAERAANGAELLDDMAGDWYCLVDPDTLDMRDTSLCILGQVYGGYMNGMQEIGAVAGIYLTGDRDMQVKYGFDLSVDEYYHSDFGDFMWGLQSAWVAEIEKRNVL